jgi:threonine/homoserine/homoserine lactone efflux protein
MAPFLEGMLAGYGIAIPVGAVAILIVNTAVQCGFKTGFMAGAGAATADLLYALLASAAGLALSAALQPMALPLRLLGGVVLMGLAGSGLWRGLKGSALPQSGARTCAPLKMYLQFVGITIINPLTVLYFTALILGREAAAGQPSPAADLQFVLGAGVASLSWQTLLALVGGVAGRRLTPRFRLFGTVLGNLLVLGLGARIFIEAVI